MAAHYYYTPLPKNTIKIKDITPDAQNRSILDKLKQNEPSLSNLYISNGSSRGMHSYVPGEEEDVSWLGKFLGKNSYVKELVVKTSIDDTFYKGLSCNKSIQKIHILHIDLSDGQIFHVLDPFKQKHSKLNEIKLYNCTLGTEGALQLSVALGRFNTKSLKKITLSYNQIGEGQMNNVITAIGMQTELELLRLSGMNIGRNECMALSTMIRWGTTKLRQLSLRGNDIDDESVKSLVSAIGGSKLVRLSLSRNRFITSEGYKTLSNLLERPDSSLKFLFLRSNNIGDDGALVLAAALTNNSTLKTLSLKNSGITSKGWSLFSKILCDTSSVNNTYLSNHTLCNLGNDVGVPPNTDLSLRLNGSEHEGQAVVVKILQQYHQIKVQPFFEWEFKVLPLLVGWFTKASKRATAGPPDAFTCATFEDSIKRMKINAIYDFVRELPMLVGCSNMGRNVKRRSNRRLGSRMSTVSTFIDNSPGDNTICNCSCVIS